MDFPSAAEAGAVAESSLGSFSEGRRNPSSRKVVVACASPQAESRRGAWSGSGCESCAAACLKRVSAEEASAPGGGRAGFSEAEDVEEVCQVLTRLGGCGYHARLVCAAEKARMASALIAWFDRHRRKLPWR